MLYVKTDRPVDFSIAAILGHLDAVAKAYRLQYLITGAMARDIVLQNVFGLDIRRATRDVDFGIAVNDWAQFEQIKHALSSTGYFIAAKDNAHRLEYCRPGVPQGIPVDLIPFEGVEQPGNVIRWPPEMDVMMNVVGYREALDTATIVQIREGLEVPVASMSGLALLKLFAWKDRGNGNAKDAMDFFFLLRNYADAGNNDRLYGEEVSIMEVVDFDLEDAGAVLLGKDVKRTCAPTTFAQLSELLANQTLRDRLLTHMAKSMAGDERGIELAERLLGRFQVGFDSKGT